MSEPSGIVTEYGQLLSGGGVQLWNLDPALLEIFPLDERIRAGQMGGGVVLRRRVIVVEEWVKVRRA